MARVLSEMSPGWQPSLWARVSELEMPTLLVAGELDEKYCRITSQMAATLPNAESVVVPECGHNTHAEKPGSKRTLGNFQNFLLGKS